MTKESIVGTQSWSPRKAAQIHAWHIVVTRYVLTIITAPLGGLGEGLLKFSSLNGIGTE